LETQVAPSAAVVKPADLQPVGLTSAEVAERVARGESNAVRRRFERTYWQIIRDNVFNLFNLVLFALVLVLLAFRDYSSIVFGTFSVVANSLIGSLQEISAKRSLDRMAALAAQDVAVWRDGTRQRIPIEQVVKDDLLPIEPGDRLCVDGLIVRGDSLELDESLLSGEADAIAKEEAAPVYSGSFVIAGTGLMRATHVGAESTINKLATVARAYRNVKTPTQLKIDTLVGIAMVAILIFGPMVIISGVINQLLPVETVRNALVLVTSLVPQGLMLSTTVSLALGAVRISRHQALIQRMNAVESLANTTVLCFDKTGTLTRNEMAVVNLLPLNGQSVDELKEQLALYSANLAHLNKTAAAIQAYARSKQVAAPAELKQREIAFSSFRKWGAVVFAGRTLVLGAPERVLGQDRQGEAVERARGLAAQGWRVLALAEMDEAPESSQQYLAGRPLALIVLSD
jgi:cation-transporting ATPase E